MGNEILIGSLIKEEKEPTRLERRRISFRLAGEVATQHSMT